MNGNTNEYRILALGDLHFDGSAYHVREPANEVQKRGRLRNFAMWAGPSQDLLADAASRLDGSFPWVIQGGDITQGDGDDVELQTAMLDVKLKHLDVENQRRQEIAALYINKVKNPLISLPKTNSDSVWHIFPIFCERRDELQQYLFDNGVETQIHYPTPPHKQKCYQEWAQLSYPITEQIAAQELSLPCHQALQNDEISLVIALLNRFS